jgi:diguanylate cyclase (GGDEF)-like protein
VRSFLPITLRRSALTAETYIELVRLLFMNRVPIIVNGIFFILEGSIIALHTNDITVGVIAAWGVSLSIFRLWVVRAFRRSQNAQRLDKMEARRWEHFYAVGSVGSAATIGIFQVRCFMLADPLVHMLATGMIFGYAGGVVTRGWSRPWLAITNLCCSALPAMISALLMVQVVYFGLALLFALFVVAGFETVQHLYETALQQIALKQQFAKLAQRDPLTGLLNRLMLNDKIDAELANAHRQGKLIALHSLDLNSFKAANDKYGHPVGDEILKQVSGRLAQLSRTSDLVARMGGDEFILVQSEIEHQSEAEILARRIVKAISVPYLIDGNEIHIGTSVGIAISAEDGKTASDLIIAADAALYRTKATQVGFSFASHYPIKQQVA